MKLSFAIPLYSVYFCLPFAEHMQAIQLPRRAAALRSSLAAPTIHSITAVSNYQTPALLRLVQVCSSHPHCRCSTCTRRGQCTLSAVPQRVSNNQDVEDLRQEALEVIGSMFGVEQQSSGTSQVRSDSVCRTFQSGPPPQ